MADIRWHTARMKSSFRGFRKTFRISYFQISVSGLAIAKPERLKKLMPLSGNCVAVFPSFCFIASYFNNPYNTFKAHIIQVWNNIWYWQIGNIKDKNKDYLFKKRIKYCLSGRTKSPAYWLNWADILLPAKGTLPKTVSHRLVHIFSPDDAPSEASFDEDEESEADAVHTNLCKAMSLCVAYAANCGGISTLTGTAPNLVLVGQVDK